MDDADFAGEEGEEREVAPGLTMRKLATVRPDGRTLIYYTFERREDRAASEICIEVPDMVCEACAASIRRVLASVHGIAEIGIDVDARQVRIRPDGNRLSPGELVERIRAAGFDARG